MYCTDLDLTMQARLRETQDVALAQQAAGHPHRSWWRRAARHVTLRLRGA